ncbi:MAG: LysR family transcriptional regulator [Betaproteobacteria bacterium]
MNRLHLINVFVAVVDAGSFVGGARRLGISPPAVTRAINELETHLGVRLLNRTTRIVRVTEPGARYAEDCRCILAHLAEADEFAIGLQQNLRGHLIVTAPALFGARFVAPIVTEYLERHPEVVASCWFLDRLVDLVGEGADIGIRIGAIADSSLHCVSVGSVRRVICAAPSYLNRHGVPLKPADLQTHVIVSANAVTPVSDWRLVAHGETHTVRLQPRLTTTSNDAALAAVLGGFGITRLLSYQVADLVRNGSLKAILCDFEVPSLPVQVVHRDEPNVSRKARSFADLVVARLRANFSLD